VICAHFKVTRAGFYARQCRQPSQRSQQDGRLLEQVRDVHARSRGFYGSPKVTGQLRPNGVCVGKRRIAKLMRLSVAPSRVRRLRSRCAAEPA
jgi:putative transposase